ncbi:LuxR C-terminal-related transcriptional regulator [Nonomuraea sp. M3C6]|uniref:LuxR C-terminal-related transcriptional regulator n=1 Tax=Nonomuraea marmarensis TaxID=3351344 RepID=A0ABW7AY32_9ACTN
MDMVRALTGLPRKPRPLPSGETLTAEDYRRLVGVMEMTDHATDLVDFQERLLRALQDWFGFCGVAALHGDTVVDALECGCGVLNGYSEQFLEEYAAGWVSSDPFRSEPILARMMTLGVARMSDLPGGREFIDSFLRRHGITDKAAMVIDAGPAGVIYVGMSVENAARVPERDLAVLRALRRHLAPLAVEHLTRDREQQAARAAWRLTPREWEVADLVAKGLTNRQIAEKLFISVDTVKKHLSRVLAETACTSRTQFVARYSVTR